MLWDLPAILAVKIWDVASSLVPFTIGMGAAYTALALLSNQACNPSKRWWRNRGLATDALYWLIIPFWRTKAAVSSASVPMACASSPWTTRSSASTL